MSRQASLNGNGDAGGVAGGDVLAFTIPARDVRGRTVRLGPALTAILAAHDYPAPLAHVLAEALVLTVLIGTTIRKSEGQTTVQAQSKDGIVDLMVCDYRGGAVRGYLRFDAERAKTLAVGASPVMVFGDAYLAITIDQAVTSERYQGIVPLEGDTLSHAVERFFSDSEQVPTLVRAAAEATGDGGWWAGGLLVQYLPRTEAGGSRPGEDTGFTDDWAHVSALASTITGSELTDPALAAEALIWRLFNEDEVRITPALPLTRGCRCTTRHFRDVLSRFAEADLAQMRGDDGMIEVNCEFCARVFPIEI